MKKIGLIIKETQEKEIKKTLKGSEAFILVKYSGVSSPDMSILRQSLRKYGARILVVKNSVARRALKSSTYESLLTTLDGPCGFVVAKDEPVGVSKALYDFVKEHEKFKIEAGFINDKALNGKELEAISKLPGKDQLRHQLVMALNAPIFGLAFTLNQVLAKLVYALDAVKKKKEQG